MDKETDPAQNDISLEISEVIQKDNQQQQNQEPIDIAIDNKEAILDNNLLIIKKQSLITMFP
ncbi:6948_t:CDS:2 [Entrophospora sp. SA101]|nr:6948_t:CDS:2 [Entrophospora sp. SA101]